MTDRINSNNDIKVRIISWTVMALMFITIWYMLNTVLLTFVITFVFYHLMELAKGKRRERFPFKIPYAVVLTVFYAVFILLLIFASIVFIPKLAAYLTDIANALINFNFKSVEASIDPRLAKVLSDVDLNKYIGEAGVVLTSGLTAIGSFGINLFFSIVLSYLLLLEKNKIRRFGEKLAGSRISFIYGYLMKFGGDFCTTFGKVMKVQVTIALINAVLSMILLTIFGFPQIMSLGVMIFILGLIPVAGMFISFVPLSIIAFNIGGISKVAAVILMIILIHTLEAYVLNPKLMSNQTELPVCFVFIILLVGEHYLGVWGLLTGVPIFIFFLNAMEVKYTDDSEKEKPRRRFLKKKEDL